MNTTFKIPSAAAKYILFQRTTYIASLKLIKTFGFKGYPRFFTYEKAVALEAKLRSKTIGKTYLEDIEREYLSIKDALPKNCNSILDVGCGIAGINLFLNQHYEDKVQFYLLDKSRVEDKIFYMFKEKSAFYNSLELAKKTLTQNGIDPLRIHLVEATDNNEIRVEASLDLVISLISWGFHYPVETYLNRVYELLNSNGILILDVRKRTNGLELISEKFGGYEVISDSPKQCRIKAVKKE